MTYQPRFIPNNRQAIAELVNLWHAARVAVGNDRMDRRVWSAQRYHEAHPEVSFMGAYKDLEGLLNWDEAEIVAWAS